MAEHEVLVKIREMILTGKLPPGERLTEVGMAGMIKVSRTPVRAALPALAEQGLLTPVGRRGFAVTAFTDVECIAALEIRSMLEGMAARSIEIRGLDPELLATLRERLAEGDALLAKRQVTLADEEAYGRMNTGFHEAIVAAAGVPVLADLVHRVNLVPFVSPGAVTFSKLGLEQAYQLLFYTYQQHHAIVQVMVEGDSGRAESLFREHAKSQRDSMWQPVPRIGVERGVTGVRIDDELRVRQMLLQRKSIDRRDDQVVAAIDYEYGMFDARQVIQHALRLLIRRDDCRVLRGGGRLADFRAAVPATELAAMAWKVAGVCPERRQRRNSDLTISGAIVVRAKYPRDRAACKDSFIFWHYGSNTSADKQCWRGRDGSIHFVHRRPARGQEAIVSWPCRNPLIG